MNTMVNTAAISIKAFGLTDIGRHRKVNEDSVLIADLTNTAVNKLTEMKTDQMGERGALFAVADGMGGASAGEIASALAIRMLHDGLLAGEPDRAGSEELRQITEQANGRIWQYARLNPELDGMGTTITAALVRDGIAYISQVGDSRAYLIRGNRIEQITKDQSLVQKLQDNGLLTPEEAAKLQNSNVILQALGVKQSVQVAINTIALNRGDYLIICSDGLSNKVTPEEMHQVVTESESPTYACRLLTELANARGGEDNITVIVARFDGEALHQSGEGEDTASLRVLGKAA